ncbi:MAG TPA: ATP-binding cassette domain-containing protein, partial [Fimbriimonadaceae bacterium]|nr:ATP-binding cassette domain-containing protein [Fimbriimonadaceae bacterium]
MLSIQGINVYYGAIHALKDLSVEVNEGEIVAIIGSNGAGKSTLLRTISGLLRPKTGRITFRDEEIHGLPAHEIVRRGIGQSPEGRRIFTNMSVLENLQLGAFTRKDGEIASDMDAIMKRFPRLLERITPALSEVHAALNVVNQFRERPAGRLKLNVPSAAARARRTRPPRPI